MPRGCLRNRLGSAEEPGRVERPSGRRRPAGHRQHGLALDHPASLQKNWLQEFYQVSYFSQLLHTHASLLLWAATPSPGGWFWRVSAGENKMLCRKKLFKVVHAMTTTI
ncbi:uncharacterized protein LOC143673273 isoform X2 [Tamandua tetradactyla]|uniref:uncharacterized protein LOC143673273 isoform X2 n=1 Tax=Tamandua tetradactyla TaxID=48850 RepID=UPI0040544074